MTALLTSGPGGAAIAVKLGAEISGVSVGGGMLGATVALPLWSALLPVGIVMAAGDSTINLHGEVDTVNNSELV